jgi:hypothetical protein
MDCAMATLAIWQPDNPSASSDSASAFRCHRSLESVIFEGANLQQIEEFAFAASALA